MYVVEFLFLDRWRGKLNIDDANVSDHSMEYINNQKPEVSTIWLGTNEGRS